MQIIRSFPLSLTRMSVQERDRADQLAGDAPRDDEPERTASVVQYEIERRSSLEGQDGAAHGARGGGTATADATATLPLRVVVVGLEVAQNTNDVRMGTHQRAQLCEDRHLAFGVRAIAHDLDRDVVVLSSSSSSSSSPSPSKRSRSRPCR